MTDGNQRNIALIGMPGCGKTTIGLELAARLGYTYHDTDAAIQAASGMSIPEIFEEYGEPYFRNLESEAIKRLAESSKAVIATGGGAVLNQKNIDALKKSCIVIFINRPLEAIMSDIATEERPLLKEGAHKLTRLYKDRLPLYKDSADIELLNDRDVADIVGRILAVKGLLQ